MKPLYSPPNGTFPQEVPAYYRENNNSVRTDLPELSHEELIAFGFTGPYTIPSAFYTDEDGNIVEGDYNPEIQYWEWDETRRNFIIKNKENEEETVLPLSEPPPPTAD